MKMSRPLTLDQKFEYSKTLPPGHVDRELFSREVREIYSACGEIEKKWRRRFRKKLPRYSLEEAIAFCQKMCEMLGERPIRAIVLKSPDVKTWASAHYNGRKEIHFKWDTIHFDVLVHELTHHFSPDSSHGKDFCDMEEFLFGIAYQEVTGKKLNSDW